MLCYLFLFLKIDQGIYYVSHCQKYVLKEYQGGITHASLLARLLTIVHELMGKRLVNELNVSNSLYRDGQKNRCKMEGQMDEHERQKDPPLEKRRHSKNI